jgi:hypothetical protein
MEMTGLLSSYTMPVSFAFPLPFPIVPFSPKCAFAIPLFFPILPFLSALPKFVVELVGDAADTGAEKLCFLSPEMLILLLTLPNPPNEPFDVPEGETFGEIGVGFLFGPNGRSERSRNPLPLPLLPEPWPFPTEPGECTDTGVGGAPFERTEEILDDDGLAPTPPFVKPMLLTPKVRVNEGLLAGVAVSGDVTGVGRPLDGFVVVAEEVRWLFVDVDLTDGIRV